MIDFINLEEVVQNKRNSLKADRLDMSFGELMNIFEEGDLIITPEYQRAFRWSTFQQTRFIESVLLGIPIPPIFVAEDAKGKWEVVDGLQRMSTILSFFGLLNALPQKNNLTLVKGEMVEELEGITIDNLPLKFKLAIKRAVCRIEIVKWDSQEDIRYELFNRLNTGSSPLSEQEIRNCIFRSYAVDFNSILKTIAKDESFLSLISASNAKIEQMFMEELSLRFFAFKYFDGEIKTTVPYFLTDFMRKVSKGEISFNLEVEKQRFIEFIKFLDFKYGKSIFRPNGAFAQHLFDSICYGYSNNYESLPSDTSAIEKSISILLEDEEYDAISAATFSIARIKARLTRSNTIFKKEQIMD